MNTQEVEKIESISILKGESIKQFASLLLDNGFKIFTSVCSFSKNPTYLHFTDGVNIGYAQEDYFGGVSISSVHKANKNTGTGFRVYERLSNPTIEQAKQAFVSTPQWANFNDRQTVVKYKDLKDYFKSPINKMGEIVFLSK